LTIVTVIVNILFQEVVVETTAIEDTEQIGEIVDVGKEIVNKTAFKEVAAVIEEDEPPIEILRAPTQPLAEESVPESAVEVVPAAEVAPRVAAAVPADPTPAVAIVETQAPTPAAAGIKEDDVDPRIEILEAPTPPLAQLSELEVSSAAVKVAPKVTAVPKAVAAASAPTSYQLPGKHGMAFGSSSNHHDGVGRRVWNENEGFGVVKVHKDKITNKVVTAAEIDLINWAEVKQPASQELKPPIRKDFNCDKLSMKPVSSIKEAYGRFPEVLVKLHEIGLISPSPLQSEVWPYLLAGKDVLCISGTGIRDPMCYLLPCFVHIVNQPIQRGNRGGANILIVVPTRELAMSVKNEVEKFDFQNIKSVCAFGGCLTNQQTREINNGGAEILIATPMRLTDLLKKKLICLDSITFLVLEDCDKIIKMGWESDLRKAILDIRTDRQTVMFSGSGKWPDDDLSRLAGLVMIDPFVVTVGMLDSDDLQRVTNELKQVEEENKYKEIRKFISRMRKDSNLIIFVRKQSTASNLASKLASQYIPARVFHGAQVQEDREQAIKSFTSGEDKVIIGTGDLATRLLETCDVQHIINHDFPPIKEFLDRIYILSQKGRGRNCISFFAKGDKRLTDKVIECLSNMRQTVPVWLSLYQKQRERYLNRTTQRPMSTTRGVVPLPLLPVVEKPILSEIHHFEEVETDAKELCPILISLESTIDDLANGDFCPTTLAQLTNLLVELRSVGPQLEVDNKEKFELIFRKLSMISQESRLDVYSKLRILEILELRLYGWIPNIHADNYYAEKFAVISSGNKDQDCALDIVIEDVHHLVVDDIHDERELPMMSKPWGGHAPVKSPKDGGGHAPLI
jgi:superfamily II DNA/RNA helicase